MANTTGISQGAFAHFSFPSNPAKENPSENAKLIRVKFDRVEIFYYFTGKNESHNSMQ